MDLRRKVLRELKNANIRAELDDSNETLGKRIRQAEKQKTPYILVVGEKEETASTVAVRSRDNKDQEAMETKNFIARVAKEIIEKK